MMCLWVPQCVSFRGRRPSVASTEFMSCTVSSTFWSCYLPIHFACLCNMAVRYNEDFRYVGSLGVVDSSFMLGDNHSFTNCRVHGALFGSLTCGGWPGYWPSGSGPDSDGARQLASSTHADTATADQEQGSVCQLE